MADHDTHDHTGVPGVGSDDLDAIITASAGQDIADALSGAAAPDAGNVFATMADVGGGGDPDCMEAFLTTADVTMTTANAAYSHTDLALTPAAGDWLLIGRITMSSANNASTYLGGMLASGGSLSSNVLTGHTILATAFNYTPAGNAGGGLTLNIQARVTLGGATVVRLAGQDNRNSDGAILQQDFLNAVDKATSFVALKITSI